MRQAHARRSANRKLVLPERSVGDPHLDFLIAGSSNILIQRGILAIADITRPGAIEQQQFPHDLRMFPGQIPRLSRVISKIV